MGTWIKETDEAIYLMDGNYYLEAVPKRPSSTNPLEKVANIEPLKAWFKRADKPRRMTISVGTGEPEPQPLPSHPSGPPGGGGQEPSDHQGLTIRTKTDTFFKLSVKDSSQLTDKERVFVERGKTFNIEYFTDVGRRHWEIKLAEPTIGDGVTTRWYVFTPAIELLTNIQLTVISDTLFKREPKLSIDLPPAAKEFVKNGTQFRLISFEPAASNHIRLELANATLGPKGRTVWYAFSPDIRIKGQNQTLRVISDTVFKRRPIQSAELPNEEKVFVRNKTVFLLHSYAQPQNLHVRVALQGARLGPRGYNTWYCFVPDIEIFGTEIGNRPNDTNPGGQPSKPSDRGIPLQFPGFAGVYYSNDPIYFENQFGQRGYFTWGQALHADPATGYYRRPTSAAIVYGILDIAKAMEDIRYRYGNKPIQVTSWYRDPATNAAIGGASQSRHMLGDGVDFVVPGVHPFDVYDDLDAWWGNRGGLASSSVFTHIDMRGYRARWDYGY